MIISASRRTDIPAFYGEWFMNRIREGYVLVRNPYNPRNITNIPLTSSTVDAFVFWTKNPKPFLYYLDELDLYTYPYYFLFSVTPYDNKIESRLPEKKSLVADFIHLSKRIGSRSIIWRYDPILLTDEMNEDYHIARFSELAEKFKGHTNRCITSFMVGYRKCLKNLAPIQPLKPDHERKENLLSRMAAIAASNNITLTICADENDFDSIGIYKSKCIDNELISQLCGKEINYKKDIGQRAECRCNESIDIGAYNTCMNHCLYCYANSDIIAVQENVLNHDCTSPLLIGNLTNKDKVKIIQTKEMLSKAYHFHLG